MDTCNQCGGTGHRFDRSINDWASPIELCPFCNGSGEETSTNRDVVDELDQPDPDVDALCPFCWGHGTYEEYNPEAGGIVTELCHCDKGERMRNEYEADQVDYETRRLER